MVPSTAAPPKVDVTVTGAPTRTRERSLTNTARFAHTEDVSTIVNSRRPVVCSPAFATRSATIPEIGASIVYGRKLSLLSMRARVWPSRTVSPRATSTERIAPSKRALTSRTRWLSARCDRTA